MRGRLAVLAALAALAALSLTGCSGGGDAPGRETAPAKPAAAVDVSLFRTVVENGQWDGGDWQEWGDPGGLGSAAEYVIIGTVESFRLDPSKHAVIMKSADTVRVKGAEVRPSYDLDVSDVGEEGGPASQAIADRFTATVPAGSRFLAFLDGKERLIGPQSLVFAGGSGLLGAYGDLPDGFTDATTLDALAQQIANERCTAWPSYNQDLNDPTPDATVMGWQNCTPADRTRLQAEIRKACPAVKAFTPHVKVTGDGKKAYDCLVSTLTGLGASPG